MKRNGNLLLYPMLGILFLLQGCVYESLNDCTTYKGILSIVLPDGCDVTSDSTAVGTIGVYQFESGGFVREIPWARGGEVSIGVEKEKSLALVAWGNLQTDTLQVIPPSVGASPDSARISLRTKADGYQFPAPDLFYGCYESDSEGIRYSPVIEEIPPLSVRTRGVQTQTFSLVMERKVSALSVRIFHLAEHFDGVPGNLKLLVRGTCASLDFRGNPTNATAVYAPVLRTVPNTDEWTTSLFRIFPTPKDDGMDLELYRNDELILTVRVNDEGNRLQAISGKEIYITVDFRYSRLYVRSIVKPWGSTEQEVIL
ncbi:MAG: FimB/Mfa2 family fimbrial subunit [Bacteroides sp.]|jgi:hypothetical protein|nr:FimB/Mfa2 family fimbrial subunit [Bacteroides sp.]